jgi:hypothetical protein
MMRLAGAWLGLALLLGPTPAAAGPPMSSGTNLLYRSAADEGGDFSAA